MKDSEKMEYVLCCNCHNEPAMIHFNNDGASAYHYCHLKGHKYPIHGTDGRNGGHYEKRTVAQRGGREGV